MKTEQRWDIIHIVLNAQHILRLKDQYGTPARSENNEGGISDEQTMELGVMGGTGRAHRESSPGPASHDHVPPGL